MNKVTVIGAGLAGCEAAWQLAQRGISVDLIEMKPLKRSPAHHIDTFAELVCSNSLKGNDISNACGLLKAELRLLGSLVIECADRVSVPSGGALSVDRDMFSKLITEKINQHSNITIINKIANEIPKGKVIVATGPLTDEELTNSLKELLGDSYLYFFDAAAPIVTHESIDFDSAFLASRYNKGTADYVNCPMNKEQFKIFWQQLITAETAVLKGFEDDKVFEGCMPIEVMAKRGEDTIRFGPLKPVGLVDDRTKERSYAVLQLRKENTDGTLYNLVGFQTHLTFGEQKRVFSLIPALRNAEFVRYGVMHRNTYINSPKLLDNCYRMKSNKDIYFAGQITGVEGYVESISSGMVAALNIYLDIKGRSNVDFSNQTIIGSLSNYISLNNTDNFQPMNANFGIIQPLNQIIRDKQQRKTLLAERSLNIIKEKINLFKE